MIRRWFAARRWRRQAAALEGWMTLVDNHGTEVAQRIPIVLHPDQPGHYVAEGTATFTVSEPCEAAAVRIHFADGTHADHPL